MNIPINSVPDIAQVTPQQNVQPPPKAAAPTDAQEQQAEQLVEESVKAEILTTADIEIRKLHALRRAQEYFQEQLEIEVSETEKLLKSTVSGISGSANAEYAARASETRSGKEIVKTDEITEAKPQENKDISELTVTYKNGTAILGYRTYKKETPKAWDRGDVDERR